MKASVAKCEKSSAGLKRKLIIEITREITRENQIAEIGLNPCILPLASEFPRRILQRLCTREFQIQSFLKLKSQRTKNTGIGSG